MKAETTQLWGSIGIVVLFIVEAIVSKDFRSHFTNKKEFNRTMGYLVSSVLVLFLTGKIGALIKLVVPDYLHVSEISVLDYVGVFVLAEGMNWGVHYLKHSGFMWRFHFQHHIDSKYTVLLTSNTHGLEVLISGSIMSAIIALLGFSTEAINTYFLFYALANTYQHSSLNLSLGPLDYLIVSPRYHRIHHSKSFRANYGSTLTIWDLIMGTYIFPKRTEVVTDIGITRKNEPYGFIPEMLFFLEKTEEQKIGQLPGSVFKLPLDS